MNFNPITKELFTDKGELIKKLFCPFRMNWNLMEPNSKNMKSRMCSNCDNSILDTSMYNEDELCKLLNQNPDTCLKIDFLQTNIKIITNG